MVSQKERMEQLLVGMTRLEEGVKAIRTDIQETREAMTGVDARLRALENWRIWILGWTTAVATSVSLWVKHRG